MSWHYLPLRDDDEVANRRPDRTLLMVGVGVVIIHDHVLSLFHHLSPPTPVLDEIGVGDGC